MSQTHPIETTHRSPRLSVEFFRQNQRKPQSNSFKPRKNSGLFSPTSPPLPTAPAACAQPYPRICPPPAKRPGYTVMPHLTCVGHSQEELKATIAEFKTAGFNQIMALRGDPPLDAKDFTPHPDGLRYANELVTLIQQDFPECNIAVAGYLKNTLRRLILKRISSTSSARSMPVPASSPPNSSSITLFTLTSSNAAALASTYPFYQASLPSLPSNRHAASATCAMRNYPQALSNNSSKPAKTLTPLKLPALTGFISKHANSYKTRPQAYTFTS